MGGGGETAPKKPKDFGDLKFPYFMHCPKCRAKLKIAKPEMVGERMPCPKCKAKIDIVTPDEDGYVAYEVAKVDHKELKAIANQKEEEEELEREEKREKERLEKRWNSIKWSLSLVFYMGCVAAVGWSWWYFVLKDYNDPARLAAREKRHADAANNTLISVD